MKKWIHRQLLLLLCASLMLPALAITVTQQGPNYSSGEFEQQVSDIGVKVMGGYLTYTRKFSQGKWHFNQQWRDIGYAKTYVSAVSLIEPSYVDDTNVLLRNSYKYTLEAASDGKIYRYDDEKFIEKTDSGFRWENRDGDWINYNLDGQIIAYGNTLGTTAQFVYNDNNQIEQVRDRTNNLILTIVYESGNPVSVVDYSGRKITYHWSDGDLVKVTDVNGHDWGYSYDKYNVTSSAMVSRAIASIITPGNIILTIANDEISATNAKVCSSVGNGTTVLRETVDPDTGQLTIEEVHIGGTKSWESCIFMAIPRQVMLSSLTDNTGNQENFSYDYNGPQKSYAEIRIDGDGVKTRTIYGSDGAVKMLHKGGQLVFSKGRIGDTKFFADAAGNTTTTKYDQYNNIIKIINADGSWRSASYHPDFNYPIQLIDENRVITEISYNNKGSVIQKITAKGKSEQLITKYSYDDNGLLRTLSYQGNAATKAVNYSFEYDSHGNLTKETINNQISRRYQDFTPTGQAKTIIDSRNNTWRYKYDKEGRLLKETDPLTHSRSYLYNKAGNLIKYTNANQISVSFSYNARNQLKTATDAYGKVSHYSHNAAGVRTEFKDEIGNLFKLVMNRAGQPQSIIDGNNISTKLLMGKDPVTRKGSFEDLTRVDYPTYTELYQYNNRKRISQKTIIQGEQRSIINYDYDPLGNITKQTDPNGHSIVYKYDAYGNVIKEDASGLIISYQYDSFGQLIQFTDRNNYHTKFEYDGFGRLISKKRLGFGDWSYSYDNNDNLTSIVDGNGSKLVYDYDVANRLITQRWFANVTATDPVQTISYGYDNNNNVINWLSQSSSGQLSGELIRDNNGRQVAEVVNYGPFSKRYQYSYYDNGQVKNLTMPDGTAYSYEYDGNNQLTRLKLPGVGSLMVNQFNWLAPAKETLPGGVTRSTQYTGLLSTKTMNVKTSTNASIFSLNFDYGLNDEVLKRSNTSSLTDGTQTIDYQYDDNDRLRQAKTTPVGLGLGQPEQLETYQLDANNNRTASHDQNPWQYNESGQLTQRGSVNYSYDGNGNQTLAGATDSQRRFSYNINNRLIKIEDASSNIVATYQYDPFGRRLSKTVAGVTTYYLYGNQGLIAEYNAQGQEVTSYGYRPDSTWGTNPVFLKTGTLDNPTAKNYYYYHNDHLGTPYKLTDNTGYVVWSGEFDSFGNAQLATSNKIQNNLRFPGQYFDQESGLHYNWYRYYDPEIGRYITSDPIGLAGGVNTYAYVAGNPVGLYDPYGLFCFSKDAISGLSGFTSGFVGGLIDTKNPFGALGYGIVNGVLSYFAGDYVGGGYAAGAVTGAFNGANTPNGISAKGAVISGIIGGTAGAQGSIAASVTAGVVGALVTPLPRYANPRSYRGSGFGGVIKGGFSGFASGATGKATDWLFNQINKDFGGCDCGK